MKSCYSYKKRIELGFFLLTNANKLFMMELDKPETVIGGTESMRKQYPLLRSIREFLFVLLMLYTIVISVSTGTIFFNEVWEESCQSLEEDIVRTDQAMTSFFDEVSRISAHLATNESILTDAMFRFPADSLKNYQATRRLQNVQLSYSYLSYIALYSQNNNRLLSTVDMGKECGQSIKQEIVRQYNQKSAAKFFYLEAYWRCGFLLNSVSASQPAL